MNLIPEEILNKIDQEFGSASKINFYEIMNNEELSLQELTPPDNNSIYIYHSKIQSDIEKGKKFNVLFSRKDPNNYINIDAEIDYVSVKKGVNLDIIPAGYGGIIRIKLDVETKNIITKKLKKESEKFDVEKHDIIYLTTQPVMDRILELI